MDTVDLIDPAAVPGPEVEDVLQWQIDRGRELVAAGRWNTDRQPEQVCLVAYWRTMRREVARHGCCGGRTYAEHRGERLCVHTWEPCPRDRARLAAELFKGLNRSET